MNCWNLLVRDLDVFFYVYGMSMTNSRLRYLGSIISMDIYGGWIACGVQALPMKN